MPGRIEIIGGYFRIRGNRIRRCILVTTILLAGICSGLAFYQLNFSKHLSVASAEADSILGLTNSYVSLYSKLRQHSNESLSPVPAQFRAEAAAIFKEEYNSDIYLAAEMVGVPRRYITTPPGDEEAIATLTMMSDSKSPGSYSQLLKRDGSLILRNMYPSIATEQSCVSCHNKIQSDNKIRWKVGDLMGAYVVERGVNATHTRYVLFGTLLGLLVSLLLWVALLAVKQHKSLKLQANNLKNLANTDPLTGCLNRRALDAHFNSLDPKLVANSLLLMLDIDHFKAINDTHGHEAGDAVLCWFSSQVKQQLRDTDIFARIGGEEFVVYCANIEENNAIRMAERIRSHIADGESVYGEITVNVTVSIGAVYTGQPPVQPLSRYKNIADRLLYMAKSSGRNRVVWSN